jgi:LacI family transcriptional regulator, repressor for deo operon, udp, cdd, tsx, nupC, and nupG
MLQEPSSTDYSIEDIAQKNNVSVSTVYRQLRGQSKVRTQRQRNILSMLQNSGHMASNNKGCYLCVTQGGVDSRYSHMFQLYREIQLLGVGKNLRVLHCDHSHIEQEMRQHEIIGVIFISSVPYLKVEVPAVQVNNDCIIGKFPIVNCDDFCGMLKVFKYLKSLGHRRIAFFDDFGDSSEHYSLRRGRYQIPFFYEMTGVEYDPELVYSEKITDNSHPPAIKRAIEQFLALKDRPTVIVTPGDHYAFCFYEELKMSGLTIPDDIGVVGWDDFEVSQIMNPPLTTIRKPIRLMAESALELLDKYIANPQLEKQRIYIEPELIIRDSVKPL